MAIIEVNGFKFYDGLASDCIVIEDGCIDEYINYINTNHIKYLSINDFYYKKSEIDFLSNCPNVEKVNLVSSFIKDVTGLYSLKNLKALYSSEHDAVINLSQLSGIEELSICWDKKVLGLDDCIGLKKLSLRKFKPKSGCLVELSNLKNIEELTLTQSLISSFKGCGSMQKLQKLELNYNNKLEMIDELEKNAETLKSLRFDCCKKIRNHTYVTCLKELEVLAFNDCREIPSIGFIKDLPKLKWFIFVNTNIVDGDLSPCEGLEYVGFLNKRHYSHKNDYFKSK